MPSSNPGIRSVGERAWVDESIHAPSEAVPGGLYVLAAVVADPDECDVVRNMLRALLPGRARRLHWRDESRELRRKIAAAIASSALASLVVVRAEVDPARQERARRKCMERLLFELERIEVSLVELESRTQSLNTRDLAHLAALRGAGIVSANLEIAFGYPSEEPMLWVPDAVAGAVGMARKGLDADIREAVSGSVTEITI